MQCAFIRESGDRCKRQGQYVLNKKHYCRQHFDMLDEKGHYISDKSAQQLVSDVKKEYRKQHGLIKYLKRPALWKIKDQLAQQQDKIDYEPTRLDNLPDDMIILLAKTLDVEDLYNLMIAHPSFNDSSMNLERLLIDKYIKKYHPDRWFADRLSIYQTLIQGSHHPIGKKLNRLLLEPLGPWIVYSPLNRHIKHYDTEKEARETFYGVKGQDRATRHLKRALKDRHMYSEGNRIWYMIHKLY
jgi:hypothetical protein